MEMQMFGTLDKTKSGTGNVRGLNLAEAKLTVFQTAAAALATYDKA
jgi:hypothetical protein